MSLNYEELFSAAVEHLDEASKLATEGFAQDGVIKLADQFSAPGFWHRARDVVTGSGSARAASTLNAQAKNIADLKGQVGTLKSQQFNRTVGNWLTNKGGKYLAGVGAAGLLAAPIAWGVGKHMGEQRAKKQRNMAFGAGLATGMAAPGIAQAGIQRGLNALPAALRPQQYRPPTQYPQSYGDGVAGYEEL